MCVCAKILSSSSRYTLVIYPLCLQEGEEFLAREAKRTKTDEDAAAEGEKEAEVSAEA